MEKLLQTKLQISHEEPGGPSEPTIMRLNDDCLIHIFKLLTIKDRINAERGNLFTRLFN